MKAKCLATFACAVAGLLPGTWDVPLDAAIIFPKEAEAYTNVDNRELIAAYYVFVPSELQKYEPIHELNIRNGHKFWFLDVCKGYPPVSSPR
jgi:hypothetical protein